MKGAELQNIMSPLLEKHYAGETAMETAPDLSSVAPKNELAVLPVPDNIVLNDGVGVGVGCGCWNWFGCMGGEAAHGSSFGL